jgi:hypothetical protein
VSDQPPPTPSKQSGRLVEAVPRGADAELRISIEEYEGHAYISIRLWGFDRGSKSWHPTRRGCSVRIHEARQVSNALLEALHVASSSDEHDHSSM